jgi:hypothetical protein
MKKLLVGLIAALGMSGGLLFAIKIPYIGYTIQIENHTKSAMKVHIEFAGPGVCTEQDWVIPAGVEVALPNPGKQTKYTLAPGTVEKKVGGCCAKWPVKFEAVDGKYKGKKVEFNPPRTGYGLSCKSWGAVIKDAGDSFVVEVK